MRVFMCRWENDDCSFVGAPSKDVATEYLDEIGNAEGSLLTAIRDFMVHLRGISAVVKDLKVGKINAVSRLCPPFLWTYGTTSVAFRPVR